jgi:hypothetical protein
MSLCVAAFLPRPFEFFLPVGCCPLCFAQNFLNAMSTAQLRCDTGISPFWIRPPVGCRPRCLIGFYFPLAALPGPCWPADHPKTKPELSFVTLWLVVFIRLAVHPSPAFAPLCTHARLHSPRRVLIAFMHSPRYALISVARRFHSPRCALTPLLGVGILPISCPGVYNIYAP